MTDYGAALAEATERMDAHERNARLALIERAALAHLKKPTAVSALRLQVATGLFRFEAFEVAVERGLLSADDPLVARILASPDN
jgi:hypothetical protein